MNQPNLETLEKSLNLKFKNQTLLLRALTHRSYLNENPGYKGVSNERLEFLGDAILQFLTSEYIFDQYDDYPEGELTNLRSKLVNTESLGSEASRLDLGQHLLISKGEKEVAQESVHILANTFEALLGAIYLDFGLDTSRAFLIKELLYKTDSIIQNGDLKDAKSLYQEKTQEQFGVTPSYKVLKDEGPDHDKTFTVGAYLGNKLIAKGTGSSKRRAQQDAAQKALNSAK
ncbi:ribonuclease III [candidate division WWE3 bacterium RIFCSPLOWO2_01_FULL_39_13]|uniref:Ribonuclease 3 n=1 Tax=candidate division WWE3 bacterium RIFCSPLOWO2_01_FULL_39_13 TaxID=1802624 RepID=A0A1F4V3X5_UNCKA|nr:MAG: ribonuclease III [candidate division WWE3 bacterium RIFCSPLOWO2_01_FULL_39_13]